MSARLTDQERAERAVTGARLQRQITDLAELLGYSWAHFRALQNRRGLWQVPVEGPLATGWPDLFLVRPGPVLVDELGLGRILAVEVKRELGDAPTGRQLYVHELLRASGIETYVWRPSDLREPLEASVIYQALR